MPFSSLHTFNVVTVTTSCIFVFLYFTSIVQEYGVLKPLVLQGLQPDLNSVLVALRLKKILMSSQLDVMHVPLQIL